MSPLAAHSRDDKMSPLAAQGRQNVTPESPRGDIAMSPEHGGGGGGDSHESMNTTTTRDAETIELLLAERLITADSFAAVPVDVARAAVATAQEHAEYASKGPKLISGLLKRYLAGKWSPPPPPAATSPTGADRERAEWSARAAAQAQQRERPAPRASPPPLPPAHRQIWQAALATLQAGLPSVEFDTWLRPAQLAALDEASATVTAPTADHIAQLQTTYAAKLRRALGDAVGRPLQLRITGP
jgi:hypothetical protein